MEASTAERRQPEGRREQILAAARAVLSEHGYERTTVSQIASRAQVAQGTFYLYFPSKEALPGELALELCREMGVATDRAAQSETLSEAVDQLIAGVFGTAEEQRDVLREANRGIELAATYEDWARITEPWRAALEAFLQKFQATGELEVDIDVVTTAFVLRDLLDRAAKAQVLFDHHDYASATAKLVQRALAR
jgi:AcrR family transcriptional regulator